MLRYKKPRLKIRQLVSQDTLWPVLTKSSFKDNTTSSATKAIVFITILLIVPTLIFYIPQNGLTSNIYLKVPANIDNERTPDEQPSLLSRIRRDLLSESVAGQSVESQLRKPRSSERQTIIVVSSNKIADDDFELDNDIDQGKVNQRPNTQEDLHDNGHEGLLSSTESNTDMDVIYANTLEICETLLISNQTNSTVDDNSTKLYEIGHGVCTTERESGVSTLYVLLYIFIVFFLFIGLAVVCDDFFIASLEAISDRLNLSEDVAGATFMAAGSSAPELFISIASAGTGSDVGVGTIVGSAVFNLLIIIALTAALAGKVLCLDWRPFIRDSVFYAISIVAFILFSLDAAFKIWESLALLLLYALYIVIMKFNVRLMEFMASWNCCFNCESRVSPQEDLNSSSINRSEAARNQKSLELIEHQERSPAITPKKTVGFTNSTTPRTNSALSVNSNATKDTKRSDPVEQTTATSWSSGKAKETVDCVRPNMTIPPKDMKNADNMTSNLIAGSNEQKVRNPTMSGLTSGGVATKEMRNADMNTPQPAVSGGNKINISTSNASPETSRKANTPVKVPETPCPTVDRSASTENSPPPVTPKIAFQSPKKSDSTTPSPAKDFIPSDAVASCTCISSTGFNQPVCTCCVIHISSQPCRYCSNIRSSPSIPLIRCSSCTSILEKRFVVSGQANQPPNGSGLQVTEDETHMQDSLGLGIRRSASLITMQSGRGFTKLINCNASNNRESKETIDEKAAPNQRESVHEEGEVQLQSPANEQEPLVVVVPCLPPVKNPQPEKPESSDCFPAVKYIFLFILYVLSYPWVCVFTWTIPKCDSPTNRKWYLPSFLLCIGWIAFLSWVMTVIIEKIGCLLNIDSYTMGLIVVAVGTSVPDAISSVLVAKEGHGDMAVSNAVGSNVFDINLGLGLPFFIRSIVTSAPVQLMTATQMCLFENLPLPFRVIPHVKFGIILLVLLVIAVAVFIFVKFRLNKQVTVLFVLMYVAFMIYAFVQEKKCYSFFC